MIERSEPTETNSWDSFLRLIFSVCRYLQQLKEFSTKSQPEWLKNTFSTIQKYTGDSISSIVNLVNECITLSFKGTKMFYTR